MQHLNVFHVMEDNRGKNRSFKKIKDKADLEEKTDNYIVFVFIASMFYNMPVVLEDCNETQRLNTCPLN